MRSRININETAEYHEHNLYVPTRTIYFGGHIESCEGESDVVDSRTVSVLIKNLHILETKAVAPINIILNTPGGAWDSGIAVYDMIRTLKSEVSILGFGQLCSMGSIILQAGRNRVLLPHTTVMIHDGTDGYYGNAKSYENWAEHSKAIRKQMYEIYYERMKVKNPNITLKQIENMCSHDTIFSAEEAVENGLADELIQYVK